MASGLEEFLAPSGLREIRPEAFRDCEDLKHAVLNWGLEALENGCRRHCIFKRSGIVEALLPGTLKEISYDTFS